MGDVSWQLVSTFPETSLKSTALMLGGLGQFFCPPSICQIFAMLGL